MTACLACRVLKLSSPGCYVDRKCGFGIPFCLGSTSRSASVMLVRFPQATRQLRVPEGRQHNGGHGGLHRGCGGNLRNQEGAKQFVLDHEEGPRPRLHDGMLHRRKERRSRVEILLTIEVLRVFRPLLNLSALLFSADHQFCRV